MDRRSSMRGALLVGAAGLGMGLMYVLDPERGKHRRGAILSKANDALSNAGETLGSTVHGAGDMAGAVARKVGDYAHHLAESLGSTAHTAIDTVGTMAHSHAANVQKQVESAQQRIMDRTDALLAKARKAPPIQEETNPAVLASEIAAATLGVLGLGAGLMYILDPAKGRARRAWLSDKAMSITRHTGREARHFGRHMGNKMKGYAAEARHASPWKGEDSSMPQSAQNYR